MVDTFYYVKEAPKSQKKSKNIKEQELLTNWTLEGAQHQKNKKWWIRHKCPYLINMQNEKYQQKSKSIPLAEPNYFVHFAMRHPVVAYTKHRNRKEKAIDFLFHIRIFRPPLLSFSHSAQSYSWIEFRPAGWGTVLNWS